MATKKARPEVNAATALFRAVSGRKDAEIPVAPSARTLIAAIGGKSRDLGGQISEVARQLKRPVTQVQRWADQYRTPHPRTMGMLNRAARKTGWTPEEPSIKGMLVANFGGGKDGSHIDYKQAAKKLGVSVNTVRNWAAGRNQPRTRNRAKLTTLTKKNVASTRFRQQLANQQLAGAKGKSQRVTVTGMQGVVEGKEYFRWTSTMCELSPEDMQDFMDVYARSGSSAAMGWLTQRWQNEDNGYQLEWQFDHDRLQNIHIGR